jgi:hypothetical protein
MRRKWRRDSSGSESSESESSASLNDAVLKIKASIIAVRGLRKQRKRDLKLEAKQAAATAARIEHKQLLYKSKDLELHE